VVPKVTTRLFRVQTGYVQRTSRPGESTIISCSRGPTFKFVSENWELCLKVIVVFLGPFRNGRYNKLLEVGHDRSILHNFQFTICLLFDAIQSEIHISVIK